MKNYSVGIVQLLRPHKLIDLLGFKTSIYSAIEITLYNASWYTKHENRTFLCMMDWSWHLYSIPFHATKAAIGYDTRIL